MKAINNFRIIVIGMALFAGAVCSHAADDAKPATLDALVDEALKKNPEVEAARLKWTAAKARVPQARAFDDPMFGVDVERMNTRLDKYSATEWMVSQKFPWFGKRAAKERVAKFEAEAVGFRFIDAMRAAEARTAVAFWDLWLAQRSLVVTRENLKLLEQFEQIAKAKLEAGDAQQADVLRAQVELAKLSNELVTMQREIEVAQAAVNRLLARRPDVPLRVTDDVKLPPLEWTLDQLYERAREYCCVVLAMVRERSARESEVAVAKLEYAPDFEVRVAAREFNGRSGIREIDTGVAINIPWLWQGKRKAVVDEANANALAAKAALAEESNLTLLEIKEQHVRADAAWRTVALYEKEVLPQSRQLVETSRNAYQAGRASFLELIEAQRALRDFQLEYDRARAEYGKAFARLMQNVAPWSKRELATGLVDEEE